MNSIKTYKELKEQGNKEFSLKKYENAINSYSKAYELTEDKTEKLTLHSNKSTAFIQLKQFKEAADEAFKGIDLGKKINGYITNVNIKLLYRYSVAKIALNSHKEAIFSLLDALQLDPDNTAVKAELNKLEASLPKYKEYTDLYALQQDKNKLTIIETDLIDVNTNTSTSKSKPKIVMLD